MLKKSFGKIAVLGTSLVLSAAQAHAAFTLPVDADVDMGPVHDVMALVVVGLFGMWGLRKVIKTTNRS